MLTRTFFGRWLAQVRRRVTADGQPSSLLVGEFAFGQEEKTFYIGTPTGNVALSANIIPAPQLSIRSIEAGVRPEVSVAYLPTTNNSWLDCNPEVWLFAYRKLRKNGSGPYRRGGFVHPTDETRRYVNAPLYSGVQKRNAVLTPYTTEYPFLNAQNELPAPYEIFTLSSFDCFQFYWNKNQNARLTASHFPLSPGDLKCPRSRSSLRCSFQFRFLIDNPDTTAKEYKLFGPPSATLFCAPIYDTPSSLTGLRLYM